MIHNRKYEPIHNGTPLSSDTHRFCSSSGNSSSEFNKGTCLSTLGESSASPLIHITVHQPSGAYTDQTEPPSPTPPLSLPPGETEDDLIIVDTAVPLWPGDFYYTDVVPHLQRVTRLALQRQAQSVE